jgi:dihydroxyacid dehydratase/phosphogluconate dehydratase
VKNGVYEAGGIPLELPVVSLGETLLRPTAMLWRNMAAIATEEMLRANPIDGVVLLGGCDKTIPALLMAAASVDLPAVVVPGEPMLTGTFRGVPSGCGTDVWRLSEEVRAGTVSAEQFTRSESAMIRSRGHCNTMGTASTMALVAEALGTVVPGVAGTPAADSRLLEAAHGTGRLIVDMVAADRRPSTFLTHASFANAIVTMAAVGGSTNAVVHLLAIAGRLGIDLTLDDFDRIGSHVPLLVDLQPAGRFLMDDFYRAGGLLAVLREVRDLLDPTALTVAGHPLVDYLDAAPIWEPEVIRPRGEPLLTEGGIAVLRGNLAPDGAIIKPAAASAG